jgi:hypothetical protein
LRASIRALQDEAGREPDPGGPLTNYLDALRAWAATHPEIDPSVMWTITGPLIRVTGKPLGLLLQVMFPVEG